ncbi:DUF106 domain-containing protein [Methanosphaerula palustris]|uniref:DUF106 domain-containing protein n=1 Tax=Methanosphaerula palustris (strain ATCC BAA-1556 / DSM 19958 / E1-9c) TaxID=521011 RepID=B8GKF8_METPE|nr:EMC3/TMCO1 family protein [Methanosphaerula palustris]ACL15841.1 protein of unknown function DUF106 transmembrane [Methanosphaerula palustris E1-9c]
MDLKKYGGYLALLLAMVLMLAYSIEWLRKGIGMAIDGVFGPLLDTYGVPFFALIIILSTLTGLYSSLIQKYTIDYERMQETQKAMKAFQAEFREAQLSGDEKKVKKLQVKQNAMMQEQLEMSQAQFKPMAYILLVSVPVFFWLLYRLPEAHADIVFPFMGKLALTAGAIGPIQAWMVWYMICSLMISQVIRKALNIGGI